MLDCIPISKYECRGDDSIGDGWDRQMHDVGAMRRRRLSIYEQIEGEIESCG